MTIAGERSRSFYTGGATTAYPGHSSCASTQRVFARPWRTAARLKPRALATLNGFNSRQPHRITGWSYREEATKPSYDLLTAVRTRRHQWLGHILRMPTDRLVRRAVLALGQQTGPPYQPGSLLMDTPLPLTELVMRAADRRGLARDSRSLSCLQESPQGAKLQASSSVSHSESTFGGMRALL